MVHGGCCSEGRTADAHDALGWLGAPKPVWQLMLMMLGGLVLDMVRLPWGCCKMVRRHYKENALLERRI